MEKPSSSSSSFLFDDIFIFGAICCIIQCFFSTSRSFLESQFNFFRNSLSWVENKSHDYGVPTRPPALNVKVDDNSLSREDMESLMESLGIFCNPDGEKIQEKLSFDEFAGLFEEKEPSLEELNEAFLVFDENRDGFIDEKELQRVLRILGFGQGTGIEDCRKMISAHDGNRDGKIDFKEFVKLLETCLQ